MPNTTLNRLGVPRKFHRMAEILTRQIERLDQGTPTLEKMRAALRRRDEAQNKTHGSMEQAQAEVWCLKCGSDEFKMHGGIKYENGVVHLDGCCGKCGSTKWFNFQLERGDL